MGNVTIEEFHRLPLTAQATEYDGTSEQAQLLITAGWLEGADRGFGRHNEDGVLRGIINGIVSVYPTDVLVKNPDGTIEVWTEEQFDEAWEATEGAMPTIITYDADPVPEEVKLMQTLPTGENPDAVFLEPLPVPAIPVSGDIGPDDDDEEDEDDEDDEEDDEDE